jgi:hypothetical protein
VSVASVPAAPSSPAPLWLHSRSYDLWWYAAVPVLLYALLVTGSVLVGEKGPLVVYLASSVLTGLPHNMITWLMIMPAESRRYYGKGLVFGPFVVTALVLLPTVLLFGTPAFGWALSINIVIAYYHITRQHQGLLHSCDGRYIQATGDTGIKAMGQELRWLVGAVAAACFVWKLTGPPMKLGLGVVPLQFTFYPVPTTGALMLTGICLLLAFRFGVLFYAHLKDGKRLPAAHLVIGGSAMANMVAAALIPNDQFFLTLALVASYHNLQYFAFCYTHHHLRAVADPGPRDLYTRWARDRRAWAWFLLPVGLGAAYGAAAFAMPPLVSAVLLNGFMISHYFVDGNMWRRKYYPLMARFSKGRVGEPPPATEIVATVPQAAAGEKVVP